MIATFKDYQTAGGTAIATEEAYNKAEALAEKLIDAYIKSSIPYWRVQKLDDYAMDLKGVIIDQVEYVEAHGGTDAYQGRSDLSLKSVSTSGFSYGVDASKAPMLYNLPISPLAKANLDQQLLLAGLSSKILW